MRNRDAAQVAKRRLTTDGNTPRRIAEKAHNMLIEMKNGTHVGVPGCLARFIIWFNGSET